MVLVRHGLLSLNYNLGFQDKLHTHLGRVYVVVGIVSWGLSLKITRHLLPLIENFSWGG